MDAFELITCVPQFSVFALSARAALIPFSLLSLFHCLLLHNLMSSSSSPAPRPLLEGREADSAALTVTEKKMSCAENDVEPQHIIEVLQNVFRVSNFREMNSHLTDEEIRNLSASTAEIIWPGHKPVFNSYAPVKSTAFYCGVAVPQEYLRGQRKDDLRGWKVLTHRLACALLHGSAPSTVSECSHRLGSGQIRGIERDFNPNNLCWEDGPINKSRGFCQMHYTAELKLVEAEWAEKQTSLPESMAHAIARERTRKECVKVHGINTHCLFWSPDWPQPSLLIAGRKGPGRVGPWSPTAGVPKKRRRSKSVTRVVSRVETTTTTERVSDDDDDVFEVIPPPNSVKKHKRVAVEHTEDDDCDDP